jgi:Fe-S cluster biogenesis protein NfuA
VLTDDAPPDRSEIEAILDKVRPALLLDGGGVRVLTIEGWSVYLEMLGSCRRCSSKPMTQKYGVEAALHADISPRIVVKWQL